MKSKENFKKECDSVRQMLNYMKFMRSLKGLSKREKEIIINGYQIQKPGSNGVIVR